jgi:meso-butanediol dehydrogenase / (S,S)-butanediol dehydrogenase / diacetyl reductase
MMSDKDSSPKSEFSGKCAFVTGAASGIGRAIASGLARQGARVAIADINLERAKSTADELGARCRAIQVDVRSRASVEAAFDEATREAGRCDIAIASAGVSTMNRAVELSDDDWNSNFDVNARGVFLTDQIATRHFLRTKTRGVIVNVASLAGKVGAPFLAHYSASKFAVLGWTQALAREVAPAGIRVNAVCPGYVRTPMQSRELAWEAKLRGITPDEVLADYVAQTPLGRLEEPEDVADVVLFLCSDAARFMTGQGVNVTGGIYMA